MCRKTVERYINYDTNKLTDVTTWVKCDYNEEYGYDDLDDEL